MKSPEEQGLPPLWLLLLFFVFGAGIAYGFFRIIMALSVNVGGQ